MGSGVKPSRDHHRHNEQLNSGVGAFLMSYRVFEVNPDRRSLSGGGIHIRINPNFDRVKFLVMNIMGKSPAWLRSHERMVNRGWFRGLERGRDLRKILAMIED